MILTLEFWTRVKFTQVQIDFSDVLKNIGFILFNLFQLYY